jgi:tRNA(Met) C34 N-acetyltransferase TmcA
MIIGGIAVIVRGVRRMTTDIDAVVRGDAVRLERLLQTLATQRILSRIDDAQAFARENLVLLLRHEPTGVDLDLSLAWTAFEHEALASAEVVHYGRVAAPMATPEALVVFKAMAARPKDIEDATSLLLLHEDIDVRRVRRHVHRLAALADEPALELGLDVIIEATRPQIKSTAPSAAIKKPKPKARPRKVRAPKKP